jgi:hypothetical protein
MSQSHDGISESKQCTFYTLDTVGVDFRNIVSFWENCISLLQHGFFSKCDETQKLGADKFSTWVLNDSWKRMFSSKDTNLLFHQEDVVLTNGFNQSHRALLKAPFCAIWNIP